jgi:ribonucleoside-diphosphate reductase subunit M1
MSESVEKSSLNGTIHDIIFSCQDHVDRRWVNLEAVYEYVKNNVPHDIKINDLYNYAADYCASKSSTHFDYNKLASMICVKRLHMTTQEDILAVAETLFTNLDSTGRSQPLINEHVYNMIKKHHKKINEKLDMSRDYLLDYFGIRTLERSYLLKTYDENKKKVIVERPAHLFMRVSLGIHGTSLHCAFETYDLMSQKYMTHATPTLFNAGTCCQQLSSCFLLSIDDDLDNIFMKTKEIAMISKRAGGIGIHLSSVRPKGSLIRGTNGLSEGIIPLCSVLNKVSRYVNQGGKRPGSIACYLEPFHADIFEFCELRKQNTGNDDNRARDLFLALWIPDLFMKRVEENGTWSLMCPNECENLNKVYGEEFETLYTLYESKKMYRRQVLARDLWKHIVECQIETGFPYMLYKDNVNNKSNQKNLGTICSSNLCCEICEYSDADNTAVCNLASLCLPRYITYSEDGKPKFDYAKLMDVTRVAVRNLNKIIDINFYPSPEAKRSNKNNRPVGIGIQGLSDVFNIFGHDYESEEAGELNKRISETMYYAAIDESKELAKVHGTYKTFPGSPFSEGKLQFHMWGLTTNDLLTKDEYDWNKLVKDVKSFGTRNSLLTALMPTASTSQIMKCCESFEPYMSNVFVRTTMAGEFVVVNENLVRELIKYDLWSDDMKKKIIINNGSVQNIDEIPERIKKIYKTAFEIKLKSVIRQSAERGPFIDQSQSLNIYMDNPDYVRLTSSHFYGWKSGLKTGMYYMRGAPAVNPMQFGIDMDEILRLTKSANIREYLEGQSNSNKSQRNEEAKQTVGKICKYTPGKKAEGCLMCSS